MIPDMSTRYLGLELKNPLVVAACPLTGRVESLRRLEEAGASAVVLPSLFEEQFSTTRCRSSGSTSRRPGAFPSR